MNGRSPLKKRNVLSSKNVNVNATGHAKLVSKPGVSGSRGSPVRSRTKIDVEQALQSSPVRQVRSRSKSPIKCGTTSTTFTFYEESEEDRAAALVRHMTLRRSAVHDENETEQENQNQKLEPSRVHTQDTQKHRKPLQDLDIDKYPGTVQYAGGREQRLTLQLGHQRALPVGVTPPRDKKVRDFFGGKQGGAGGAAETMTPSSSTTDDIPLNKVVRKLEFRIAEGE
ncbi:hypothetical protein KLU848_1756 [Kluyveromyces marxianus]